MILNLALNPRRQPCLSSWKWGILIEECQCPPMRATEASLAAVAKSETAPGKTDWWPIPGDQLARCIQGAEVHSQQPKVEST